MDGAGMSKFGMSKDRNSKDLIREASTSIAVAPPPLSWLGKKPFPGVDAGKGLGGSGRVFEAQLAASLWPSASTGQLRIRPFPIILLSIKIFTARCNDF
jgi:hypothetical protein